MPIYAYKCDSCGFAKDVLQKMSDAPLEVCPSCAQSAFKKQLTAAGFQLKGSGWYATDFKGSGSAPVTGVAPSVGESSAGSAAPDAAPAKTDASPAAAAPAAAAPAASGG
jgi:putative FmdB family regulatory protein